MQECILELPAPWAPCPCRQASRSRGKSLGRTPPGPPASSFRCAHGLQLPTCLGPCLVHCTSACMSVCTIEGVAAWQKSSTEPQHKCREKGKQAKVLAAPHISFPLHIGSMQMPLAFDPCPWEQGRAELLWGAKRSLSSAVNHIWQRTAKQQPCMHGLRTALTSAGYYHCRPQ
jgi:hypothetical protein